MSALHTAIFFILLISVLRTGNANLKVTDQVFFDVESNGEYLGRIVIGLFGEEVPRTVKNFKRIARKGIDGNTYEGTKIFRIMKRLMIQGGDILHNNGSGSISIYGNHFKDENFRIKHNGAGVISMANAGPNTNGCQFFITTMALPYLDGHHVAFGRVLKGQGIIHKIEYMETDSEDRPRKDVVITKSGIMENHYPFYENEIPYEVTLWAWFRAGWFPLSFSFAILAVFQYIINRLNTMKSIELTE